MESWSNVGGWWGDVKPDCSEDVEEELLPFAIQFQQCRRCNAAIERFMKAAN